MNAPAHLTLGPSPWRAMGGLLRRDVRLAFRRKSEWLSGVFFFVLVAALFPLAIGPEPATLRAIGPGVLWVAALLASMLSLGRLFESDHQDGSLEQMSLSAAPLSWLVVAKLLAHWLICGLPLVLLSPLLGLQFALEPEALFMLGLRPSSLHQAQHCIERVTTGIVNQAIALGVGHFKAQIQSCLSMLQRRHQVFAGNKTLRRLLGFIVAFIAGSRQDFSGQQAGVALQRHTA